MLTRTDDIGIVLAGGMRSHQENYAAAFAAAGCRLLAVGVADGLAAEEADRHAELAQALELPLLKLGDAIGLEGATVASVAVRMPQRRAVATACAAAGLHLYLDKPLAGNAADAASIAVTAQRAGVRAQVFSHVTAQWAQQASTAVRSGHLGRILAVHADMLMAKGQPAPVPAVPRLETAAPADYPEDIAKREMTDMGVYPVSLICWLLGLRVLAVNAATGNHFFTQHLSRNVEDYGAMLLRLEDDVVATVTCGRTGWHSHHEPYLARIILVGEQGSMVFGTDQPHLLVTASGSAPTGPSADPDADPMGMWISTRRASRPTAGSKFIALEEGPQDVAAFVSALTSGSEAGITVAAAVHHCEVLAAAYRSAAEEREVAVVACQSLSGLR